MTLIILAIISVIIALGSICIAYGIMHKEYLPMFRELEKAQKVVYGSEKDDIMRVKAGWEAAQEAPREEQVIRSEDCHPDAETSGRCRQ